MNELYFSGLDCLVAIGSHARGDDEFGSDVDLLGIGNVLNHKMINVNKINLSVYSYEYMNRMMRDGELFALHIKKEGTPLVNENMYNELSRNFNYKLSYEKDKKIAYIMGYNILYKNNDINNWILANKRITWCVRTFILSEMAERKDISFSKPDIAYFASTRSNKLSFNDYISLVNAKSKTGKSLNNLRLLQYFLNDIDEYRPSSYEYKKLMESESILKNTLTEMLSGLYFE